MFVDSTFAIDRVRDDVISPSQRFEVTAIETYPHILARDKDVTVRWVAAHSGASSNEAADEFAKSAATGDAPVEIPAGYHDETSLWHMTRISTEARSRETAEWISRHVRPERCTGPLRDEASAGPSSDG